MNSQLLADALAQDSQFEVTGIEPKPASILDTVARQKPHVVLVSSVLEGSATLGFDLTRQLRSAHAEVRVVLLMDVSHSSAVVEAFRCGARGVSRAPNPRKHLRNALQRSSRSSVGEQRRVALLARGFS